MFISDYGSKQFWRGVSHETYHTYYCTAIKYLAKYALVGEPGVHHNTSYNNNPTYYDKETNNNWASYSANNFEENLDFRYDDNNEKAWKDTVWKEGRLLCKNDRFKAS